MFPLILRVLIRVPPIIIPIKDCLYKGEHRGLWGLCKKHHLDMGVYENMGMPEKNPKIAGSPYNKDPTKVPPKS